MRNLHDIGAHPHLGHATHLDLQAALELHRHGSPSATRTLSPASEEEEVLRWGEEERCLHAQGLGLQLEVLVACEANRAPQEDRLCCLLLFLLGLLLALAGLIARSRRVAHFDLVLTNVLEEAEVVVESVPLLPNSCCANILLLRHVQAQVLQSMIGTVARGQQALHEVYAVRKRPVSSIRGLRLRTQALKLLSHIQELNLQRGVSLLWNKVL
mmetsp:Transcript_10535/g.23715  ORF Transcript_10535/g.23715 Transcript_10535/m.23715 type:complete len:213 (-) Transcript_10535:889-1527(-)